jgi:hypothetical protein
MVGLSIWHLILGFLVGVPVLVGFAIWLAIRASKRSASTAASRLSSPGGALSVSTAESRLQELASLRAKGVITESEYQTQRAAIITSV